MALPRFPALEDLEEWISRETRLGSAACNAEVTGGNDRLELVKQ